jgi:hypothetical protein
MAYASGIGTGGAEAQRIRAEAAGIVRRATAAPTGATEPARTPSSPVRASVSPDVALIRARTDAAIRTFANPAPLGKLGGTVATLAGFGLLAGIGLLAADN